MYIRQRDQANSVQGDKTLMLFITGGLPWTIFVSSSYMHNINTGNRL